MKFRTLWVFVAVELRSPLHRAKYVSRLLPCLELSGTSHPVRRPDIKQEPRSKYGMCCQCMRV